MLSGAGGGEGYIGDICRCQLEWWQGVGGGSPYAIPVTYVTEEHLMFVKWTLTYLTASIIRGRGQQGSGGEGGRGGYRGSG